MQIVKYHHFDLESQDDSKFFQIPLTVSVGLFRFIWSNIYDESIVQFLENKVIGKIGLDSSLARVS